MQLSRPVILAAAALAIMPAASHGQSSCTLALGTSGTLGLSADGTILGSEEGGGSSGTITIISVGSNVVDVASPVRIAAPPAYEATFEQVEVAYSGLNLLAGISQDYTPAATSFAIGTIALSVLEIDNRIVNPAGFAAGSYATRTVITCN